MPDLPEGFTHVLEEDDWLNDLWSGRIDVPDRQAMDLELLSHLQEKGYDFQYEELKRIVWDFPHGAAGSENGRYVDETLRKAGFPRFSTIADVLKRTPRVEYAWAPYLPRGYLTTAVGDPGAGKSAVVLDICGRLLTGRDWPDGQPCTKGDCVIWADTESTQALLAQRVQDWDLPTERILMPLADPLGDFRVDDTKQWGELTALARFRRPSAIVIDSLRGSHGKKETDDVHLQAIMKRLATMARELNTVVLVVHHVRKSNAYEQQKGGALTLERVRGSSVIAAMSRVVWGIDKPDPSQDLLRLSVLKSNLGPIPGPLGFRITEAGVEWEDAPEEPRNETAVDRAAEFLQAMLQSVARPAGEIFEEAEQSGISRSSINRGKVLKRVVVLKKEGRWIWSLPAPFPIRDQ